MNRNLAAVMVLGGAFAGAAPVVTGLSAVNLDAAGQEIQSQRLQADGGGRVTFPQFRLTQREGNRLILSR